MDSRIALAAVFHLDNHRGCQTFWLKRAACFLCLRASLPMCDLLRLTWARRAECCRQLALISRVLRNTELEPQAQLEDILFIAVEQ